jgi:transcriptional regulator with XRE-family HTH domain
MATLKTAQRIKVARAEAGWTQKQLAAASGVDQADISKYERGALNPNAATLDRIMAALSTAQEGGSHTLAAIDGALGIQGRAAGKLVVIDPTAEPVPIDWIVDGFVARRYLTMIAGEPGAGKSFVTQTIGAALAAGADDAAGFKLGTGSATICQRRELDGTDCDGPGCDYCQPASRVLVVDAENGPNLIQMRARTLGLSDNAAANYIVAGSEGLDIYKDRDVLEGILTDYENSGAPVDLLVLDSWTSLWFGNENVVDQVMACLSFLNDLAARRNLGILLIHHTDKEGETYRGSSAIAGTIGGGVFTFARYGEKDAELPEARLITCKKLRIAPEPHPRRVYVTPHGIAETM